MLNEIIKKNYIQVNMDVSNFEEAIIKSIKPLLDNGAVEQSYVDKIIEIYQETGPYIVITKNVALPHAPAMFGAKDLAIGLTILNEPVNSGHETNDPVKFLFSLSSPDSKQHLDSISNLVQVLSQPDFLKELAKAENKDEVLEIIKKFEEE